LVINPVSNWDISYSVITGVLFLITGTTPQPFHPRDLQSVSYEKFEIKDHNVYRNVSIGRVKKTGRESYFFFNSQDLALSPEATASIISWATFQWVKSKKKQLQNAL
jgi:hypothetical protein